MNESLRFGRIAGIPVGAHWSVLFMVLIVSYMLAANALPELVPGRDATAYWLTAVLAALVFVASLLAHELAHSLTARRFGLPVQRITLWMLGGVSVLDAEPATPRAAFLIAAAGPATSLGLGILGGGGGLLLLVAGAPGLVEASVWWLAVMNVVLGLFNLLPGAPLDGGRILRALLWRRYGDANRATAAASVGGQVVAGLLALAGVVQVATGYAGGLWLLVMGYVIALAATAEGREARVRGAPQRTTAAQLMRTAEVSGSALAPVEWFLATVVPGTRQLVFPVIGPHGEATGVVSLSRLAAVPLGRRGGTRLGDVQVPMREIAVVSPQTTLGELTPLVTDADSVALVVDGGRLVGLITGYDVARATLRDADPDHGRPT